MAVSLGSWARAVGAVLSPFVGVGVCSSQGDRPDLGENETVFTEARSVPVKRPGRTAGRARRAEPNVGGVPAPPAPRVRSRLPLPRLLQRSRSHRGQRGGAAARGPGEPRRRGWGEAPLPRSLGGVPAAPTNPCHAGGQSGVETHTDRQAHTCTQASCRSRLTGWPFSSVPRFPYVSS